MSSELSNIANVTGTYNSLPTSLTSEAVVVSVIDGLTMTKEADKASWANGPLTYTITVKNETDTSYVSPVITDVLDTSLVSFIENSVYINGVLADDTKYSYDASTKTLTINLEDITANGSTTVTFQVKKA